MHCQSVFAIWMHTWHFTIILTFLSICDFRFLLVLAGKELTSFTVASVELHFGFALNTALICRAVLFLLSRACTQSRPFPYPTPSVRGLGLHKDLGNGGTHLGQVIPHGQRDTPDLMASWSAYRAGQKRMKGGHRVLAFLFPGHLYMWRSRGFLGMDEHLPTKGKWWMHSLSNLAGVQGFCFPYSS